MQFIFSPRVLSEIPPIPFYAAFSSNYGLATSENFYSIVKITKVTENAAHGVLVKSTASKEQIGLFKYRWGHPLQNSWTQVFPRKPLRRRKL